MNSHPERSAKSNEERAAVVVGNVIYKDGKFLLVQEKNPKVYGVWNLPAGHVDSGESFEQAAIREALEETGYNVRPIKKLAVYQETAQSNVKHIYLSEIVSGKLTVPADEMLDVKWLTLSEIEQLESDNKLRAPWTADVIRLGAQVHG